MFFGIHQFKPIAIFKNFCTIFWPKYHLLKIYGIPGLYAMNFIPDHSQGSQELGTLAYSIASHALFSGVLDTTASKRLYWLSSVQQLQCTWFYCMQDHSTKEYKNWALLFLWTFFLLILFALVEKRVLLNFYEQCSNVLH